MVVAAIALFATIAAPVASADGVLSDWLLSNCLAGLWALVLTPSTPFAYSQVLSRTLASFRVLKLSVCADHQHFRSGFDSRQLHRKDTGQGHKSWPVSFLINIRGYGVPGIASEYGLLYRHSWKQTSTYRSTECSMI